MRSSESRAEAIASELLSIRGWKAARPPKGNLLWKNEYRDYPHLMEALSGRGKRGRGGDAYPDFIVMSVDGSRPLIVGETKASESDIDIAAHEASDLYGQALADHGLKVLAAGVAGNENSNIAVRINKLGNRGWKPISYRDRPIQWIPNLAETTRLLEDDDLFDLQPRVPSNEILAQRGDEINRLLRECKIKDEFRPAITGAFMLALWHSKGQIRMSAAHVLQDINAECKTAFVEAGKPEIANSILVPEDNEKLAAKAFHLCHILRLLNITTLTAEHDYLGQLYETFFRFTGGNTIGQFFTPRHITQFMVELTNVSRSDILVDPTCGTGGFLIAALNRMIGDSHLTQSQINSMVKTHLKGFESEPITAALCVANMILRGDGKTGVIKGDCFTHPDYPENEATIAVGNPPFPHKKTDDPPEKFIDRGLEALRARGKLAMVVPASLLVKANKKKWRQKILKNNTLEGVITLPSELFQPYAASTTAILIIEKGIPHPPKHAAFFCRIENDGYRLKKNARIEQPGEELTRALNAFHASRSEPGFCSWKPLQANMAKDWAPGAYIEAVTHPDNVVRSEIDWLIRSVVSFNVRYAPELNKFSAYLQERDIPQSYRQLSGRAPRATDTREGTLGKLFDIYYGQRSLHNKENLSPGASLVISAAGSNNGCYGFFEFDQIIVPPFATVPSTGSIGEALIQLWPCGVTDDCLLLIPKSTTDEDDLFIASAIIRLERWRFNYGRKITPDRIAGFKIDRNNELKLWVRDRRERADKITREALAALSGQARSHSEESEFATMAAKWKRETKHLSAVRQKSMHPIYQRLIGFGPSVVPLILKDLQRECGHWFWALQALTGTNPVAPGSTIQEARESWLAWGKKQNYIR